jgi:GT2 family glycosyltransferase
LIPHLDIVIVNWNSGKQLCQSLASIESAEQDSFILSRVCVVDNASQDDSVNEIEQYELPIQIIHNDQNKGFAVACNQGARGSKADYLLFLNPDVRLFKDSLLIPTAFMERPENEKVAIVGIQLVDASRRVARTCARFPRPGRFFSKMLGLDQLFPKLFPSHFMREWDHSETRIVDQVMGAFFLVRRSVFESLGSFDERFFVYFEEVGFSYRVYQAGWKSVYLATAQAYHAGGGTSKQIKARRLFYSLRSRILYGYKYFGFFSATLVMLGTILIEPFSRLIWAGLHRSLQEAIQTVQAYSLLSHALPAILRDTWQGRVGAKK